MLRVLLFLSLCVAGVQAQDKPNVVFILADDLGYGDIKAYGHPYSHTPNLDKLARDGIRFTRFYSTGITCGPSRTGFMASRHPASFPNYPPDFGMQGVDTVTDMFKKNGYRTGHFGKWHLGPTERSGTYGIDSITTLGSRSGTCNSRDRRIFDASIKFIEDNRNRNFFVNVWNRISHTPVNPNSCLVNKFKSATGYSRSATRESAMGTNFQDKLRALKSINGNFRTGMENYLADVWSMDQEVGRIVKRIDDLGLARKTIIIFSSDQGAAPVITKSGASTPRNMLGYAGGLRGGKHDQWDGGVRIPFIVRWTGTAPARRTENSIMSALDLLPSLASLAGISYRSSMFEGENMSRMFRGTSRTRSRPLFWRVSREGAPVAMLDGKWKFHMRRGARNRELYDLTASGTSERRNVCSNNQNICNSMASMATLWNNTLPRRYAMGRDRLLSFNPGRAPQKIGGMDDIDDDESGAAARGVMWGSLSVLFVMFCL